MLHFKILVTAISAILVSDLINSVKSQKIDNVSVSTSANHLVVICSENNPYFICGGSLIHSNWVLSSATCILDLFNKNKELVVAAGLIPSRSPEQMRKPTEHYIHKLFNPKTADFYNFALIKVDKVFTKSKLVDVIRLPGRGEDMCKSPKIVMFQQEEVTSRRLQLKWWKVLKLVIKIVIEFIIKWIENRKMRSGVYSYSTKILNQSTEACEKRHGGWPLVCGDTIMGVEHKCQQSGPDIILGFTNVETNLDFIIETTGFSKKKGESKVEVSYSSTLHSNQLVLLMALLLVICF